MAIRLVEMTRRRRAVAPALLVRACNSGVLMPWFVVYRSETMNRETRSPPCPTERSALTHARALDRDCAEVVRIEEPDGAVMSAQKLDDWLDSGPEMVE